MIPYQLKCNLNLDLPGAVVHIRVLQMNAIVGLLLSQLFQHDENLTKPGSYRTDFSYLFLTKLFLQYRYLISFLARYCAMQLCEQCCVSIWPKLCQTSLVCCVVLEDLTDSVHKCLIYYIQIISLAGMLHSDICRGMLTVITTSSGDIWLRVQILVSHLTGIK